MTSSTPLFEAIENKDEELVIRLLQSGANPNVLDRNNRKPLFHAIQSRVSNKAIKQFLQCGAQPDYEDLECACEFYDLSVIEKLILHGAHPRAADCNDPACCILHKISYSCASNKDIARICELMILQYGFQAEHPGYCQYTPLWVAAYEKNNNVIETLLIYGAEPLSTYHYGGNNLCCALCCAFGRVSEPVMELMVKYAALHVNHSDDVEVQAFFQNFLKDKRAWSEGQYYSGRKYLQLAQNCLAEINKLKCFQLNKMSMFDFVLRKKSKVSLDLIDTKDLLSILSSASNFPIYLDVILKKIDRNFVTAKVLEVSNNTLWSCANKKLDTFSVENIAQFLSIEDVCNLLLAMLIS